MTQRLDTRHHDRDVAGMTYVYPVVSRRANGVSVGVNLNVNNACNWRCLYCQVPGLQRGAPDPIDLTLLESELRRMLDAIVHGSFMAESVPEGMRRLNDIALSGNGEPTSAPEFAEVVTLIGKVMADYGLLGKIKVVLISNGSLMYKENVQTGLACLRELGGEVWFKIDRATASGLHQVNQTESTPERVLRNLQRCAALCPTWIQTCVFALDDQAPDEGELAAYLGLLRQTRAAEVPIAGVLLYGLARASTQPEAPRLSRLPEAWLERLAERIRPIVAEVRCYP